MRAALVFALVVVGIAVANAALTCRFDENKCQEDECCSRTFGIPQCKKLRLEDERCEMHPVKHLLQKHYYLNMCECGPGLKCVAKDGIVGKVLGTCQPDSGEEPEPEPEE